MGEQVDRSNFEFKCPGSHVSLAGAAPWHTTTQRSSLTHFPNLCQMQLADRRTSLPRACCHHAFRICVCLCVSVFGLVCLRICFCGSSARQTLRGSHRSIGRERSSKFGLRAGWRATLARLTLPLRPACGQTISRPPSRAGHGLGVGPKTATAASRTLRSSVPVVPCLSLSVAFLSLRLVFPPLSVSLSSTVVPLGYLFTPGLRQSWRMACLFHWSGSGTARRGHRLVDQKV